MSFSEVFKKLGFKKDDRSRPRGFVFPPLSVAREAWDRAYTKIEWDDAGEWSALDPNAMPVNSPF